MNDAQALNRLGIPTPSRTRRALWIAITVLAVLATVIGIAIAVRRAFTPTPPQFERASVERSTLIATVTATGTLAATNTVTVGAEVSGRVARVHAEPNDVVHEGDVLVELDPDQLEASVREARANVQAAQAALRVARTTAGEAVRAAQRADAMQRQGLVPDSEAESALAGRERADAEVASASARLELARATLTRMEAALGRSVIRSPITGVVLSRQVEPGQAIAAQFQTPALFELAEDLSHMRLTIDIDEADVGSVEAGQQTTFTVDAFPERTFEATIRRIDLAPRTVQGVVTYQALLDVDNHEHLLRPGMTATATIVTRRHEGVLVVPDGALRFAPPREGLMASHTDTDGSAVWTIEQGRPQRKPVRIVASDGNRTAIEGDGITEGLQVLTGMREAP